MKQYGGTGHNQMPGGERMYAIAFHADTQVLKDLYPNESWNNAYYDVRNFHAARGFQWMQGRTYFGNDTIDAVRCVRAVQKLSARCSWFKPAVRDIRMLRIEENNDLQLALDDDTE
jgi:virulence-associated protein VapD